MELEDLFYYDPSWRIIICKQCGVVPQTNITRHIRRHHNATRAFKVAAIKLFERSLDHLPLIRAALPANQMQSNKLPNKSIKYLKILFQTNKSQILDLK
jgi:hypothetical protein